MSVEVSNVMIQQWCKSRVWSVECWCWSAWSRRYIIIIPLCQGRAPQLQSLLLQVVLLESPVLGTSAQLPTLVPPAPVQEVWQIRWQFRSQLSYKLRLTDAVTLETSTGAMGGKYLLMILKWSVKSPHFCLPIRISTMGLLELLCFDSDHNDNIVWSLSADRVIDMAVIMSESCSECQNQQSWRQG